MIKMITLPHRFTGGFTRKVTLILKDHERIC